MTKDGALALLESMASLIAMRHGIQHGLSEELAEKFAEEIAKETREAAKTGKSNEELKIVFSAVFKKYSLPDADFFKIEGG